MAASPVRLRVLAALRLHNELCVCDLAEIAEQSSAAVSSHLQKLKRSRIVRTRRAGQRIMYSLADHPMRHLLEAMMSMEASP